MRLRNREYRAECVELEGRSLLSTLPVESRRIRLIRKTRTQSSYASERGGTPIQLVTQNAGEATVKLLRYDSAGSLQVRVTTVPSPAVGVNVGAVDQTVTFADGEQEADVTVPILQGAANPGDVDVSLTVKPMNPSPDVGYSTSQDLDLRVVASDPTLPPKVVSSFYTPEAIVLTFNKPMDPATASDVNNYKVTLTTSDRHTTGGLFGLFFKSSRTNVDTRGLKLESAQYDAATQSVSLVPRKHSVLNNGFPVQMVLPRARSLRRPHRPDVGPGLTDVQGNSIDGHTTSGKVEIHLTKQTTSSGSGILNFSFGPRAF